jgi:hypothetical protein
LGIYLCQYGNMEKKKINPIHQILTFFSKR